MILSDIDIKKALKAGRIKITPKPDLTTALGTMTVDLRLGHDFIIYRRTSRSFIDVKDTKTFEGLTDKVFKRENEAYVIHPGEFVLASTFEAVQIPNDLAGRLEGKSSLGRLGIVIHSTASKVDPGFKGHLVLEITNIGTLPVMLYPKMRICQLLFEELTSPTSKAYSERKGSKYKNQKRTVGSKVTLENKE